MIDTLISSGDTLTQAYTASGDTLTLLQEFVPDEGLMEYVKNTARDNEFFAGGAVLTALGAVAMYGRGVLTALLARVDRLLRYQMTISQDQSFMLYTAFTTHLVTRYPHKVRNSLASVSQEGQSPQMEAKLELRQATDAIMIWVRWWPVFISKKRDRMDNAASMDVSFDEEYLIWAFFGRKRIIRFVSKILEDHIAGLNKEGVPAVEVCTFSTIYGNIKEQRITSFKTFDTLYLGEKVDQIKADLDKFLSAGATYRRLGIRNKRSYLLYGPPGTGKSSVAIAIAAYTGRRLVPCPIADMTTQGFVAGIRNLGNEPLLLLFDDVHVYWEEKDKTVSISSLLSVLDGIDSPNDVIIVFTANRTETMDPAFLREGRIDRQWFIGNASSDDVCRFYKDLFGEEFPAAYTKDIGLPMCAVQEAALQMDGPDAELFHQKLAAACSTRNS